MYPDQRQRRIDEERGKADRREADRRFAALPPELPPLPATKQPPPFDYDAFLEKRKEIIRDEKEAFNRKYGYTS